jgi:TetR/AcrR family transcriptional regulator, cholesterol catabolism regulator
MPEGDLGSGRRAALIAAAAQLFDRKGYAETTVEDIARAVGLSKASLYNYVTNKAEILVWIHNDTIEPFLGKLSRNVATGVNPKAALHEMVVDILEVMDSKAGYLRVFFEHHREIPEPMRSEVGKQREHYLELVEHLIAEGIRIGSFRDVNIRLTALSLFGMTNWTYQWYRPGGTFGHQAVAEHILDLFLRGVEAQPAVGIETAIS